MSASQFSTDAKQMPAGLARVRTIALAIGVLGLAVSAVVAVSDPASFFRSYLFGYMFWIGLSVGAIGLLMVHHLTAGAWGFLIQRVLEAASRTVPLMLVLFVPIAFGMTHLYEWTHADVVHADHVLEQKAGYLNVPFFLARAAVYFAVWIGLMFLLGGPSRKQDDTGDGALTHRLQVVSGPGLVLFGLTVSFSAIDWVMSLEPHWFSTVYGLMYVVGDGLSVLAFVIVMLRFLNRGTVFSEALTVDRMHDLGKLLFAFTMLWAYLNLSQFLIIWMGNLPEETPWYFHRLHGGWAALSIAVIFLQFVIPFFLLLTRATKRRLHTLGAIAGGILLIRFLDLYWLIMPGEAHQTPVFHLADLSVPIGIGGIWVAVFLWSLCSQPLLAVRDPRFKEAFRGEH